MSKINFLQNEFPKLVATLSPEKKGNWGVMNVQQMIEHMAESISFATGKNNQTLHTPLEHLAKFKEFAMSDKEFKPNTKNILLSENAYPKRNVTMQEAIAELEKETNDFIHYFEINKNGRLMNSFFGDLNYEEWLHLLHKHAVHHCKQFGLL